MTHVLHLHHLQNSRSFRIVWLLEELGFEYQLTTYERTKAYLAPDSLKQVHPLGTAPILQIDDQVLAESGFIIEYLMQYHDPEHRLHPESSVQPQAWQDYTFWLHFAEATAMPPLVMRLVFSKVVERSPALIRPISKGIQKQVEAGIIGRNIDKVLSLMEAHLAAKSWFARDKFTAADIQMHFVGVAANARGGLDKGRYPNILDWLARCESRPAFLTAVERGGRLDF